MSDVEELRAWWMNQAHLEAEATLAKAVEYGANSMLDLGRSLARAMHRPEMSDEECMELSCFFYAQGKMGRWLDAIVRGDRPGDDTPYDIRTYMGMVRRIRATGSWPGEGDTEVDWDSIVFGGKRRVDDAERVLAQRKHLVSTLGTLKHQMGTYPDREHHRRWMRDIEEAISGVLGPPQEEPRASGLDEFTPPLAAPKRHDPTHGQIDFDIQDAVEEMEPDSLGQRVAIQQTLQTKRDRGLQVLGVVQDPKPDSPPPDPDLGPPPPIERTTYVDKRGRVVTVTIFEDHMQCADSRCLKIHDPTESPCDEKDLGDPSTDPTPGVPHER